MSITEEHHQHKTPAEVAIAAFGGCRKLASLLGKSPSSVSRWKRPRRGCASGGAIPTGEHRRLLELAKSRGIELTAEDLIYGRKVA